MVSKLAVLLDEDTKAYKVYKLSDFIMEEVASGFTDKEDAEKFKAIREQGGHAYMINNYEACEFIVDLYMLKKGPYISAE